MLPIVSEMDGGQRTDRDCLEEGERRVGGGRYGGRSSNVCFRGEINSKRQGGLSWTLIRVRPNQLTLQTGGYNERTEMGTSFLSSDN